MPIPALLDCYREYPRRLQPAMMRAGVMRFRLPVYFLPERFCRRESEDDIVQAFDLTYQDLRAATWEFASTSDPRVNAVAMYINVNIEAYKEAYRNSEGWAVQPGYRPTETLQLKRDHIESLMVLLDEDIRAALFAYGKIPAHIPDAKYCWICFCPHYPVGLFDEDDEVDRCCEEFMAQVACKCPGHTPYVEVFDPVGVHAAGVTVGRRSSDSDSSSD